MKETIQEQDQATEEPTIPLMSDNIADTLKWDKVKCRVCNAAMTSNPSGICDRCL